MSNHHKSKSITLHHSQVDTARERQRKRAEERNQNFLVTRRQLRMEYNFMLVCGFICFAFTCFAIPVYWDYFIL